jgi:hypothetical protein
MSQDIFKKTTSTIATPRTADNAFINWDGIVTAALNINIGYNRGVSRHRTIGNQKAVLVTSQPAGQISIAQIVTTDARELFSRPGWDGCIPAELSLTLNGCPGTTTDADGNTVTATATDPIKYTATGCLVSGFNIGMEAEGVTIIQNVTIEFLQLLVN